MLQLVVKICLGFSPLNVGNSSISFSLNLSYFSGSPNALAGVRGVNTVALLGT